jgi:glycosyltransferase involved in cell wall biosynthesis
MDQRLISVIIPVLNETANIDVLFTRLAPVLDGLGNPWELIFIDDGSTDDTLERIRSLNARDGRVSAVSFSRNFGKEIAVAAGLRYARGAAAILMDADLQHPPEVLAAFVEKWREGYQVVFGQRVDRITDGAAYRMYSSIFYSLFNSIARSELPRGAGDFRLLDRKAIDAMNTLTETARFNKGLFTWIGFRSIGVPYVVAERAGGTTKWNYRRLARFAVDGITSFSTVPLRVWSLLGLAISLASIVYAISFMLRTMVFGIDVPGFPSLIISVMMFSGIQLISLGVIGEYLGRVYEEVKARPLFLVADEIGPAALGGQPGASSPESAYLGDAAHTREISTSTSTHGRPA